MDVNDLYLVDGKDVVLAYEFNPQGHKPHSWEWCRENAVGFISVPMLLTEIPFDLYVIHAGLWAGIYPAYDEAPEYTLYTPSHSTLKFHPLNNKDFVIVNIESTVPEYQTIQREKFLKQAIPFKTFLKWPTNNALLSTILELALQGRSNCSDPTCSVCKEFHELNKYLTDLIGEERKKPFNLKDLTVTDKKLN